MYHQNVELWVRKAKKAFFNPPSDFSPLGISISRRMAHLAGGVCCTSAGSADIFDSFEIESLRFSETDSTMRPIMGDFASTCIREDEARKCRPTTPNRLNRRARPRPHRAKQFSSILIWCSGTRLPLPSLERVLLKKQSHRQTRAPDQYRVIGQRTRPSLRWLMRHLAAGCHTADHRGIIHSYSMTVVT